jgi:hypothetical protein
LSATIEGDGWSVGLPNALAAVKFGSSQQIPVIVRRSNNAAASAVLTVMARSESDSSKSAITRVRLSR